MHGPILQYIYSAIGVCIHIDNGLTTRTTQVIIFLIPNQNTTHNFFLEYMFIVIGVG